MSKSINYKIIELEVSQNYTKKVNETKFEHYRVKWFFEGFDKLLSKTTFLSQLSLSLDFQPSPNFIGDLDQKIDQLRQFFQTTSQALQRYLSEIVIEEKIKNIYLEFLINFYKELKDYVNNGLIPFSISEVMHQEVQLQHRFYNSQDYQNWQFEDFRLKTMKKMRLYIKRIANEIPNDQVYGILVDAYKTRIGEQEVLVNKLKMNYHD